MKKFFKANKHYVMVSNAAASSPSLQLLPVVLPLLSLRSPPWVFSRIFLRYQIATVYFIAAVVQLLMQ